MRLNCTKQSLVNLSYEKPIGIDAVVELTGYCRGHIYRLIRLGQMPCHKPTGGRLFFKKSEVLEFIYSGKKDADYEIFKKADDILNGEKK
jgi:excisionase family DNA binding protein